MSKVSERPAEFILELARQAQLLACLKWLANYQLLACIPLRETVPLSSLAKLANVPEQELCRIARMAITAGFLQEPETGLVGHSTLSRQFVSKPSLLDAATFLAETALPAALSMTETTRLAKPTEQSHVNGHNAASTVSNTIAARCGQEPRLRRQVSAFSRLEASMHEAGIAQALVSLDWRSLGVAKIVEVGATSLAASNVLHDRHPGLQITAQTRDTAASCVLFNPNPEIAVQQRELGARQMVFDAVVYILHLPTSMLSSFPSESVRDDILKELQAHFDMLRLNPSARLMIATKSLPEPGSIDMEIEAAARIQDLLLLQMAKDRLLEMSQILELVDKVGDDAGHFVIAEKRMSRRSATVILEARIEAFSDR